LIGEAYISKNDFLNANFYFNQSKKEMLQNFIAKEFIETNIKELDNNILFESYALARSVNLLNNELFDIAKRQESFCHYTSINTVDKITFIPDNTLRYYNANYMNDPSEGKIMFKVLSDNAKKLFTEGNLDQDNNIYIGSFFPSNFNDNLVMWRTYGKENGNEACGSSITIKKGFFDTRLTSFYKNKAKVVELEIENKEEENSLDDGFILRKVLYCDINGKIKNDEENITKDFIESINKHIDTLALLHKSSEPKLQKNIARIVCRALSDIQYLFKSQEYSYENEFRVVKVLSPESDKVKIDDNTYPKKVFINANRKVKDYISDITIGPKVNNKSEWLAIETKLLKDGKNIKFKNSSIDFQ
jgi:hypothetical protein